MKHFTRSEDKKEYYDQLSRSIGYGEDTVHTLNTMDE